MEYKRIEIERPAPKDPQPERVVQIMVRKESGELVTLAESNANNRIAFYSQEDVIAAEVEQRLEIAVQRYVEKEVERRLEIAAERYTESEVERRVKVIEDRLEEQFEEKVAAEVERRLEALAERR